MDKIETFKALLPFVPARYRRPLLFYIHFEEMMNIMNSLRSCLNAPSDFGDNAPKNASELIDILKSRMSKQDADMLNMLSAMQNMSSLDLGQLMGMSGAPNAGSGGSGDNDDDNEDFSEEIDDLFKDFINETKGETDS